MAVTLGKRIATFVARVKAELHLHKRKASFENFSHASLLKSATKYYTVRVIPLTIFITYQFVYDSKLPVNSQRKYANILWASFAFSLYTAVLTIFPPCVTSTSSEFSYKTYLRDLACPQNEHRLFIINNIELVSLKTCDAFSNNRKWDFNIFIRSSWSFEALNGPNNISFPTQCKNMV